MRALFLALWLVWATAHAGYRTPAPSSHDDDGARITGKNDLAVLIGASCARLRLFEARQPEPAPVPLLPPGWVSSPELSVRLAMGASAWLSGAPEHRRLLEGLGSSRSSRGPPPGRPQIPI